MTWKTDLQSIFTANEIEQGRFPVGYRSTGTVTGREATFDDPWWCAMILVQCPDRTTISYTASAKSKDELPRKGDSVLIRKTAFAWEIGN